MEEAPGTQKQTVLLILSNTRQVSGKQEFAWKLVHARPGKQDKEGCKPGDHAHACMDAQRGNNDVARAQDAVGLPRACSVMLSEGGRTLAGHLECAPIYTKRPEPVNLHGKEAD